VAEDAYGNYQAGLSDNVDYVTPQSGAPVQTGTGSPTANTPVSPVYLDSANNNIWINPSLTTNGWVLSTSGGGGSVQVMSSNAANPNTASVSPDNPTLGAIYYQTASVTPYNIWIWDTAGRVWVQFSAP
jgi:hypothetical protein